jgi:hypothetical protein
MSRNPTVPKDYIPGDEICKSCIGIAYLDKEMKKRNEHYTCFGIKRTLTRTVPMENLEKHDKREDNDSDKIVCIGNNNEIVSGCHLTFLDRLYKTHGNILFTFSYRISLVIT